MSGNAKFRWFLLAPILLAISVVVNSPVVSWAGELEEEKRRFKEKQSELARLKARELVNPDFETMFPLDPFVVSLAGTEGKRFLRITVFLEISSFEVYAELTKNIQKITDSITILLSSKSFEDVYSVRGKYKLKDEITVRVNRFLVAGHMEGVYFTEFAIQ